ncbi:MAG: LysE family translocator [Jiangellaceae bacterium]
MDALILGVGLGLFVAAQPGAVTLLVLRTAGRGDRAAAWAVGAAAALVDALYATAGAAGAAPLLAAEPVRLGVGVLGAAVLILIGARTLWSAWRVRAGLETGDDVISVRRAFATGFGATASNPLTILSWAAIFAAASVSGAATTTVGAAALVTGIGLGSLVWFTFLSAAAGWLLRRASERFGTALEVVSGMGLVSFGGWLGWRTVAD